MKRLAWGLSVTALLSGCIFLTPPTGLRIGDHSAEFANVQAPGAAVDPAAVTYLAYDGPDFSAIYPKDWGDGKKSDDFSGPSTTRLSAGVRTQAGEAEGIVVTTVNQVTGLDNAAFAVLVKRLLAQDTQAFEIVSEKDDTLGGEPAVRIEAKSTDANGNVSHMLNYGLIHQDRGWVVVISTPDARYATLAPVFAKMVTEFKFKAATAAPSGAPTTAPSGTTPASPGASGAPAESTPTPSPTVTPSGAPNVPPPTPDPNATQAPSPSPTP